MPATQLADVLAQAYGPHWHRRFRRFSFEPVAAASIGQVHRAVNRHALFAIADDALYRAKKEGRNRVAFLSQPTLPLTEAVQCQASTHTLAQRTEAPGEQGIEGVR